MNLGIENRTALVTGSYRGTGQIIAQTLMNEGVNVLVHGLEPGQAEEAVAQLGGGIPVTGNIVTEPGSAELLDACQAFSVDILVNNYGVAEAGSWTASESDDWITSFQKNVLSVQRLCQGLLPTMVDQGWGRIINLGTVGSTRPNSRMPAYYTAKGALATMTVSLAKEIAATGVRVNLVSPGLILTPEVEQSYLRKGMREGWGETWEEIEPFVAKDIPIKRIARREEVASLVAYLCSPLADAIHGQNYRIDGGVIDTVS
jgi:3-oxoacyl-[acyl-carrier protein] reductase